MFKILLCFLISVAWAQAFEFMTPTSEIVTELLETAQTCAAETGTDADTIHSITKATYSNDPDTEKFLLCYMKRGRYTDSEGYFIKENILPIYGTHEKAGQMGGMIDMCNEEARKVNYKDQSSKAFGLMECYHKNTPLKLKLY